MNDLFTEYTTEQLDSNIAALERQNPHFPDTWNEYLDRDCICTSCTVCLLPGGWDEEGAWTEYMNLRWLRGDNA